MRERDKSAGDPTAEDVRYMAEAIKEARRAEAEGEVPIGAVVVCQGQIIGRGHNQTERLEDVTAHAEIIAMSAACQTLGAKYLTDCTIYVTVEPCVMCGGALGWAQVGRVVYGASDEKRGCERVAPRVWHPKTEVSRGVMSDECAEIVRRFFSIRR